MPPPIPQTPEFAGLPRPSHARGRSHHLQPSSAARNEPRRPATAAASPEVISSLITSLSGLPSPTLDIRLSDISGRSSLSSSKGNNDNYSNQYGMFSHSSRDDYSQRRKQPPAPLDLDELAASSPVVRTSKQPPEFSPLTALGIHFKLATTKGNSTPSTTRPTSRSSNISRDDARSIGNLSIERSFTAPAESPKLRRQRSQDGWGKKTRAHKSLIYMPSRERLQDREKDQRKRATIALGGGVASSSSEPLPKLADLLAKEPDRTETDQSPDPASPHAIPQRESSLHKTCSGAARAQRRSKRDSLPGTPLTIAIPEVEEKSRREDLPRQAVAGPSQELRSPGVRADGNNDKKNNAHSHNNNDDNNNSNSNDKNINNNNSPTKVTILSTTRQTSDAFRNVYQHTPIEEEDSAPFPAVSQGRRRDEQSTERHSRRLSGRFTPDADTLRPKRSSSRLKRLSQTPMATKEEKAAEAARKEALKAASPHVPGYERPSSADSVDDRVESYLFSPRLSQKIRHPQSGRTISFSEVGDPEGSAVFCCVGMGLTRYVMAFYDELASALKLRLITPDRPGVGDSEPYPNDTTTPLSWPDDVYAICQALRINKFSILAHSAGAIYALATALRMPQHIRGRIHLLAPWIPPSQMNTFGTSQAQPPANSMPTSQRILRALPTPFLKVANSSFMAMTSSSTSSMPRAPRRKRKTNSAPSSSSRTTDKDAADGTPSHMPMEASENMDRIKPTRSHAALNGNHVDAAAASSAKAALVAADRERQERQALFDNRLTHAIWELATTNANPAGDLLVCLERRHPIGFRYVDITRPVVIHHGSRDTRVPVQNVTWLGKMMRRCEVRVLEGEGHGLMASAFVMGGVLMEIGKEWDDWTKVTGGGSRGRERERRGTLRGWGGD